MRLEPAHRQWTIKLCLLRPLMTVTYQLYLTPSHTIKPVASQAPLYVDYHWASCTLLPWTGKAFQAQRCPIWQLYHCLSYLYHTILALLSILLIILRYSMILSYEHLLLSLFWDQTGRHWLHHNFIKERLRLDYLKCHWTTVDDLRWLYAISWDLLSKRTGFS